MTEEWKDIKGYEGLYQVSNLGRVKSLERKVIANNRGGIKIIPESIKKSTPFSKDKGYMMMVLYKNNNGKCKQVHRLVAEAFIPNPFNLRCVNHKDYDPSNNRVENLEWVSHKENSLYSSEHYSLAGIKKSNKKYGGYIYKHHKGYRFEATLKNKRIMFFSQNLEEVKKYRDKWLAENKPIVYNYLYGN